MPTMHHNDFPIAKYCNCIPGKDCHKNECQCQRYVNIDLELPSMDKWRDGILNFPWQECLAGKVVLEAVISSILPNLRSPGKIKIIFFVMTKNNMYKNILFFRKISWNCDRHRHRYFCVKTFVFLNGIE